MKKVICLLTALLIISTSIFGNQVMLNGILVKYELPSQEYKEIINNGDPNNPRQSIIIKFPEIYSDKYQLSIIPNLGISSELVPEEVTSQDYFFFQLDNFQRFGIDTDQTEDDILECNMPSPMTFFSKYERDGVIHNIFHVSSVYNGVAFSIIFDATDDIYHIYRDTLQDILESLHVVDTN